MAFVRLRLRDGRALFIVQPSDRSSGSLLISQGRDFVRVPLQLGERALWLKKAMIEGGVEEREPGVLGAWAIAGNDLRGVRIGVDGKVTLGADVASSPRTVVSGRYAFDWGTTARGKETTDGGMSWSVVDLPASPLDGSTLASAACGPVGASEGATRDGKPSSWLRIGWGSAPEAPDLVRRPRSSASRVQVAGTARRIAALRADRRGRRASAQTTAAQETRATREEKGGRPRSRSSPSAPNPPPLLRQERSRPFSTPATCPRRRPCRPRCRPLRTCGPRFEGSLRPRCGTRKRGSKRGPTRRKFASTSGERRARTGFAVATCRFASTIGSIWPAREPPRSRLHFGPTKRRPPMRSGLIAQQPVTWSALLEVSGQAAVIVGQRPGRTDLYGAAQGEPVVAWRDVAGAPLQAPLPFPGSVVRIGSTWFYLGSTPGQGSSALTIYRVDGGVVRRFARLPRVSSPGDASSPRLTRRARGRGLALDHSRRARLRSGHARLVRFAHQRRVG